MRPLTAYLVEDSPLIQAELIATLEELLPLQVLGAADNEAAALLWLGQADHAVDVVIVDIFLKGGSGLGVLRAAQHLRAQVDPRRHWVVLSNYATPDIRRSCLELGADRIFDKSREIEDLIQYCEGLVQTLPGPH